ncbi:MAG: hypothetical protein Q9216_002896 [Gyalolechia sp. 2 TL-2023]
MQVVYRGDGSAWKAGIENGVVDSFAKWQQEPSDQGNYYAKGRKDNIFAKACHHAPLTPEVPEEEEEEKEEEEKEEEEKEEDSNEVFFDGRITGIHQKSGQNYLEWKVDHYARRHMREDYRTTWSLRRLHNIDMVEIDLQKWKQGYEVYATTIKYREARRILEHQWEESLCDEDNELISEETSDGTKGKGV